MRAATGVSFFHDVKNGLVTSSHLLVTSALTLVLSDAPAAQAVTLEWHGGHATWFNQDYWYNVTRPERPKLPSAGDDVFIHQGTATVHRREPDLQSARARQIYLNSGLEVTSGGQLNSSSARIAAEYGDEGEARISGAGASWDNGGRFYIGYRGKGEVEVTAGGQLSTGRVDMGFDGSATGSALVSGPGSAWTSGMLVIGNEGDGTVEVTHGGRLNSSSAVLGYATNATGSITVTGKNSEWTTGPLTVGRSGQGSMIFKDHAKVSSSSVTLGTSRDGSGTASLSSGANWTVQSLSIGNQGKGVVTLHDGNQSTKSALNTATTSIGTYEGASGQLILGAFNIFSAPTSLVVGGIGAGTFSAAKGTTINTGNATIGDAATGKVTLTGSSWTSTGTIYVGGGSHGTLSATDGTRIKSVRARVGERAGSNGVVELSGKDTRWDVTETFFIGGRGKGSVAVSGGAQGAVSDRMVLGDIRGSEGTLTVNGPGSSWTTKSSFEIGREGLGNFNILNGAHVTSDGSTKIGGDANATGMVTVSGAGSRWTAKDIAMTGQGATSIQIRDGALVEANTLNTASDGLSVVTIGGLGFNPATAPGTLTTQQLRLNSHSTLHLNHTDTSRRYQFTPVIAGNGRITVSHGATVFTANSRDYTGNAEIQKNGVMIVNGAMPKSKIDVWGVLGGSGTTGTVNVHQGGRVEPGNSIGTIRVGGDFNIAPGAVFQAEINGNGSDRIEVAGTATVNGGHIDVVHDPDSNAPVLPGQQYTLLTTGKGLTVNQPMTVAGKAFAFLDMTLSRDSHNAYLTTSRNNASFASLANTPNEKAVAGALDASGASDPLWRRVVGASGTQARAAFASLTGGAFHASVTSTLMSQSHHVRDAVFGRLSGSFGTMAGPLAGQALAYAPEALAAKASAEGPFHKAPFAAPADEPRRTLWAQGLGSWGKLDGNSNTGAVSNDLGGVMSGFDVTIDETWRAGIAGGYSHSTFRSGQAAASGSSDNYHIAVYGGGRFGAFALRGGASYSWHDVSTSRTTNVVNLSESLRADYSTDTTQVFGELGYTFAGASSVFEPFANVAYTHMGSGSIAESGGITGVTGATDKFDTVFTTLGMRGAVSLADRVTLRGLLGWRHAFGDVTPAATLALNSGTGAFIQSGAPIGRDSLVAEAGLGIAVAANADLTVSYVGQLGSDGNEHGVRGVFAWRF